jgi:predicted ABC-class ATPase
MKLVSFIANGSILPRRSGISDLPLSRQTAVEFISPPELEISLDTLHSGSIRGMGIPEGITLIIGGGFHGKSTLLSAIERGIYNHIPGDGREFSVSVDSCVKIRAEEGRSVKKVNISSFISNLPLKKNTEKFSTTNASGSTSQAANIIEALECRSRLLLLDEDTSATNFLIRDSVMQKIVPKTKEPITPFIDRVKNIYNDLGTSSVLVMGGSGDYFSVADTVIMMDTYRPFLVTEKAKEAINYAAEVRAIESGKNFTGITQRCPIPSSIDPYLGRKVRIRARGLGHIVFGAMDIDLSAVEQIVSTSQVNTVPGIIVYALRKGYIDGINTIMDILDLVFFDIEKKGLDVLSGYDGHPGSFAYARKFEVAAAINRLRSLQIKQKR